jgi:predicted permease
MSRSGRLESLLQDTRHALRGMCKKPGFAVTAILILALAIGGNTAIFAVIRAVLLKPLQYRDPDRLVTLGGATPTRFAEMRAAARSFSTIVAVAGVANVTLAGKPEPEILKAARVSAGFLRIGGVEPLVGRTFRDEEDAPGGAPVAMISAELWARRFANDPQIAGTPVSLSSTEYTIIGVVPPHFQFPYPDLDVWVTAPSEEPAIPPRSRALSPYLTVYGRLDPGVTIAQANAEARVIRSQYIAAHPTMLDAKPRQAEVTAMKDELVAGVRTMLLMLFGAVGLVLLIACANVAGLLLARATSRSREFAVRCALGAGRARLIRQLLVESILLSLAGGAVGVMLATWLLRLIPRMTAFTLPRAGEIQLDWIVLAFTAALSIATGVLFGLAPSFSASRPDLMSTLRTSGAAGASGVHGRLFGAGGLRGLLVAGQVALSVILLIGAALLVESIAHLRSVDLGFNPSHVAVVRVSLSISRYDTDRKRVVFHQDLIRGLESSPGIRGAAAAGYLPMMGYAGIPVQDAAKPPLKLNERPIETLMTVTPAYFQTMRIPMRRGRDFRLQDDQDAQRVAIIDESLARQFWPAYPTGQDPIGKMLFVGGTNPKPAEVIGIVADARQVLEGNRWPGTVYLPFTQGAPQSAVYAIRTDGDPLQYTKAIAAPLRALDRDRPFPVVRTMDALVEDQVGERRLLMILLESFALTALVLALIGLYGVMAYSVSQRTQELGIRRALGAQNSDILWLIVGQGLIMVLAGIVVGLAGAFAVTRIAQTLLFQVSATDPATFFGVSALFLVVTVAASLIPACRAASVDPMEALRI